MPFLRRLLLIGILVAVVSAVLFGVGVSLRRAYVWRQFLLNQDRELQSLDQPGAGVVLAEAARRWPEAFQEYRLAESFHITEGGPALVGRLSTESERDERFVFVALLHFQDERIALVRLEDGEGRLIPNDYAHRRLRVEPQPPWRDVADYDRVLRAGGWAETLEALVWLGGEHASPEADDLGSLDKEALGDRRAPC